MDIATLGCSVNVRLSADLTTVERFRIAFGVAAPTPIRSATAEAAATGQRLSAELVELIGEKALADVTPRSSWRAAKEFRLHLVKELARRATFAAIQKAGGTING